MNNLSAVIADIGSRWSFRVQGFLTRQLASSAAGMLGANITPDQLLARTTGEILNPNLELLFNGPTLRSFRFSFKMTPRNDTEAGQIKNIIRCFKKSMSLKKLVVAIRKLMKQVLINTTSHTKCFSVEISSRKR